MAINAKPGMETYGRILNDARVEGKLIGAKHHLHDRHMKKYMARISNLKTLEHAREVKAQKATVSKARKSINAARERIAQVTQADQQAADLRAKFERMNRTKLADTLKTPQWATDDRKYKSVGNGL